MRTESITKSPSHEAAAARFDREARALDAAEIVPLRADPVLAERNVAAGVAAVMEFADHVREHLPAVDLEELQSLPDLARRVALCAHDLGGEDEERAETARLLAEANALRRTLRAAAAALVEAGVLAPKDLAKIGRDRGAIDAGADCGALASLFERRAEEIAGKTPIEEEQLARAAELAAELKTRLKPKGAAKKAGPSGVSPAEMCDRLWTLLAMRHERLWAVGAYIYGHAVDEYVPALAAPSKGAKARGDKAK